MSLRAAQEQRNLEFGPNSQIKLCSDSSCEYLLYNERMSKNKSYGLKHCRMEPKETRIYARPQCPEKCVVSLYKEFVSHRPESHNMKGCSSFYLACKPNPSSDVWYKASPLGIHSIESATKTLFAGSEKFLTNTSLRRTAKNRLVSAGIAPEVAQKKTGRISSAADAAYIDASIYEKSMSDAIYGTSSIKIQSSYESVNIDNRTIEKTVATGGHSVQFNFNAGCNVNIYNSH